MRVLIIEDEAPAFRRLQKILEGVAPEIEILEVLDSVSDSVEWLQTKGNPDLIFMDIQLSDGLSFRIFDEVALTCPVIFTTAYDAYMMQAFKVSSIDYLLKPIKEEDLRRSLAKYQQMKESFSQNDIGDLNQLIRKIQKTDKQYKPRFLVKQGDKLISVETQDISFFNTRNGVVFLYTAHNRNFLMDYTLDELSQQLDPQQFYRANRQYLINFKAIKTVHKYHKGKLLVELDQYTDHEVVVSAEKASTFKGWLGN